MPLQGILVIAALVLAFVIPVVYNVGYHYGKIDAMLENEIERE